jgi:Zn-dependent protease with chaperone function
MDPARFGALVRVLEQRSREQPKLYRAQVALVAALGYGYVFGLLFLLFGLIAGLGYGLSHVGGGGAILVKLMVPLLGLAFVMLRALWIRVPDLEGIDLPAERFPALAAAIEGVRAKVDAPRFRRVLLDGDFNACVAQRPRFGLVGPSVSDLALGLPLMQALSIEEFEAVLAHELGHVSRQHGRFGHWIYRIRTTWARLAALTGERRDPGARLLLGCFLSWYAPFFGAYSFVLARQDEYEADQTAVRIAGQSAVATALPRIAVLGRFHAERHWASVMREATRGGELPSPHAEFASALANRLDRDEVQRWLELSLRRPTDYADTHPSLSDRLRAIAASDRRHLPDPPAQSAADVLLGAGAIALAKELDTQWRTQVEPQIAQVVTQRKTAAERLQQLEAGSGPGVDAAWERVYLLDRLDRTTEARRVAEGLLQTWPDHVPALFFLGQLRLKADDAGGIPLLERAASLHSGAGPAVQELIFDYYWSQGRLEEAEAARGSLARAGDLVEAARRERSSLGSRMVLVPHGLPAEKLEPIQAALANVPGLRGAYVVRRTVVNMPDVPCYLVGLVPARRWWKLYRVSDSTRLCDQVIHAAEWPESTYFVVGGGQYARLVRQIGKVAGSRIVPCGPVSASPRPKAGELELVP